MPLDSPLSTVTDYALAVASAGFAVAMWRRIGPRNRVSGWFWCAAFAAAGVAAAAGGTYHGLETRLEPSTRRALWNLVMFSIGAAVAFVAAAIHAAHLTRTGPTMTWLGWGIVVTVFGVAVQQGALPALARWDGNAAYHLIQTIGLLFFYRCARTMSDRSA